MRAACRAHGPYERDVFLNCLVCRTTLIVEADVEADQTEESTRG